MKFLRPTHHTSHYSRDVTFAEDRSRIRTNPGVFARLRSFGFNILKANRTDTLSQDRCHVRFQGVWPQNLNRFFSFRLRFV